MNDVAQREGGYYYNARWMDPSTGRFITVDPARDGVNWFSYVAGNPLRWVDPTGLFNQSWNAEQREAAADYLRDLTPDDLEDSLNCAVGALWIADQYTQIATGETIADTSHRRLGGDRQYTWAEDLFPDSGNDVLEFYRDENGNIDRAFNSANVEAGTFGVLGTNDPKSHSGHVVMVKNVERDRFGNVMQIHTIQTRGGTNALTGEHWKAIEVSYDANQFDEVLVAGVGDFLGWAERGEGSTTREPEPTVGDPRYGSIGDTWVFSAEGIVVEATR